MPLKHVNINGIRLHLNPDRNLLTINGNYTVMLNNTARTILDIFIECCKIPGEADNIINHTLDAIQVRYPHLERVDADRDLKNLIQVISDFGGGQIPFHLVENKEFPKPNVPERMDLALTYMCTNSCSHCYLHKNKNNVELTTDQWKRILQKLWRIGIPHVVFTGGECTIRKDLPELIRFGREMITGVITNGVLITPQLAKDLKDAELDWIQITLESNKKVVHDEMQGRTGAYEQTIRGIQNAVIAGLPVRINATLTKKNYKDLPGLIKLARQLGVNSVSTNIVPPQECDDKETLIRGISESELVYVINNAKDVAKTNGIQFSWFLPGYHKNIDQLQVGFRQKICSACNTNMMIEPDGVLVPCQNMSNIRFGNFLITDWKSVWNGGFATAIREDTPPSKACETYMDKD